jgi:aspartate carbamoyltransferase catalytic subunit
MSVSNPEMIGPRIPHSGGSKRDFLTVTDFSPEEVMDVFKKTEELKRDRFRECFKNKAVGLIFQKPSLRTRVSFQVVFGSWADSACLCLRRRSISASVSL